jgi:hypothetical protein
MKMSSTLAATLIASVIGTGTWFFGLAKAIWPAHEMVCTLLLTIVIGVLVQQLWPDATGQKRA